MSGISEEPLSEIDLEVIEDSIGPNDGVYTTQAEILITEIRRLRAENKELRASYERVDKHAAELSRQREEQADMIRWWNPLYR